MPAFLAALGAGVFFVTRRGERRPLAIDVASSEADAGKFSKLSAGAQVATHPNMLFAFGRAAPVASGAFALSDEQGAFA